MSAADDVSEMRTLAGSIADLLTASPFEKDRIAAVRGVFKDRGRFLLSWNRALEFLRGKPRLVQSWEMEHAKRQLRELKRLERERRDHAHLNWLAELIASDPALAGRSASELQHLLRAGRDEAGAVAQAAGQATD